MKKLLQKLKSNKGMSLAELMVGMAVLVILILTVSTVFMQMSRLQQRTVEMAELNSLLDNIANPMISDLQSAVYVTTYPGVPNRFALRMSHREPTVYSISGNCDPGCTCVPCTGVCAALPCTDPSLHDDPDDPDDHSGGCGFAACDGSNGCNSCTSQVGGCTSPCTTCNHEAWGADGTGVLLRNGNSILPKAFYRSRSVDFIFTEAICHVDCECTGLCDESSCTTPVDCECDHKGWGRAKTYIVTIILMQDSTGQEITRREYTVRPLMLNQYN